MAQGDSIMPMVERREDPIDLTIEDQVDIAVPNSFEEMPSEGMDIEIIQDDDGGVIVDFDPSMRNRGDEGDFNRNLAEELESSLLGVVGNELMGEFDANKASRKDWEDTYRDGLDMLGFTYSERTLPFRGSTGVTHPLLAEAATQFQAQAFNEMLPPDGPVRTAIVGEPTKDKEQQARRVKEFMNYYITNVMEEYTPEFDQMLFFLPLAGSTFKKVYFDEGLNRAVSKFVPAENLVVPYETSSLETCPCITNVVNMPLNELRKLQISGFYADVDVLPGVESQNQLNDEMDKIQGVQASNIDYDVTLLEFHVELDLSGFEDVGEDGEETGIKLPYVVTVVENSGKVISIRRNYLEDDEDRKKIQYFVHYKFLPGFGFYGLGLIHTIGGLSRTATAALRQLIDAGTLSNLPAGFKARGMRIRDDAEPLQPGEFRDVDAPGGAIRDNLIPLPFKGPDQTLFQLLGFVVDAGQRFATITDLKVGEGNQNAPVGTTVAMLEQGSRVMSAVHKRMHYSMRQEFKLMVRVMHESLPQEYPFSVEGGDQTIMASDFDGRIDVVPISNPNVFSQAQRIALAQAQLQMATQAPEMHNMHEAFRRMYDALGVKDVDRLLNAPSTAEEIPKDPAQENIDAIENVSLKAFDGQNHDAHIMSHLLFSASPLAGQTPSIITALQKHVTEHVKIKSEETAMMQFMQQSQGQPPTDDQLLEIEMMIAQNIAQELQAVRQMSQQIAGQGQEQPQGPDPLLLLKEKEIGIKEQQTMADIANDQAKLGLEEQKMAERSRQFDDRLQSQEQMAAQRLDAHAQRELVRLRANRKGY
tara:strand:- start:1486 stop:3927 length:2442 start_codon:yes stop_codon:yes gene_type:complete